ncbi:hypothetical protein [Pseudaeromonas paramecii]|uniref:Uncharacterized protein n=1 Tax=Pseudaeromonas paramecii TaxID=2138166 RepID=A0ABP8PYA2_9GAMM
MTEEQRLEPGAAAQLALNTLTAQIQVLIASTSGSTKLQAESLQTLLVSNMQMITEASNDQVDDYNAICDVLECRDKELQKAQDEAVRLAKELRNLQAGRAEDEKKVRAIMAEHEQVKNQRDNYKRDADETGKLRAEVKRLKNQAANHVDAQAKKDAQLATANQTIQRLRSRLGPTAEAVRSCLEMMRFTRNAMIFEGVATEQTIEHNGEQFHIYRRPGNVASGFKPMNTDQQVSRAHQFYFRVETNSGYHCDVVPLANGDAAAAKHKALPVAVKKHLVSLFNDETMFDRDKLVLRSDALSERLNEIEATIVPLDALLQGLDRQLITQGVVSHSRVNASKHNKRRAA